MSPSDRAPEHAPDRYAHRAWLAAFAALPESGTAADLGCGRGDDLRLLAARHPGPDVRLVGVDTSAPAVAVARAATADPRVSFVWAPLDGPLPFADASLDLVVSHNLLECVPDPGAFARDIARVLRAGGQVIAAHWDWDTQVFDGTDKALVRRLVAAYADWQQAWMAHAEGWMGRRLQGVFHAAGRFEGAAHARVLTNIVYAPPWFGHENAQAMRALARRGMVPAEDVERFLDEQAALHAAGRYFYSITGSPRGQPLVATPHDARRGGMVNGWTAVGPSRRGETRRPAGPYRRPPACGPCPAATAPLY